MFPEGIFILFIYPYEYTQQTETFTGKNYFPLPCGHSLRVRHKRPHLCAYGGYTSKMDHQTVWPGKFILMFTIIFFDPEIGE
jgi:hypothetical protein